MLINVTFLGTFLLLANLPLGTTGKSSTSAFSRRLIPQWTGVPKKQFQGVPKKRLQGVPKKRLTMALQGRKRQRRSKTWRLQNSRNGKMHRKRSCTASQLMVLRFSTAQRNRYKSTEGQAKSKWCNHRLHAHVLDDRYDYASKKVGH